MLLAVAGTGCYRATGINRPTLEATEIPEQGGDKVTGLKATAGAGDFYLGNDFTSLAVDGGTWLNRGGQFGAPSGGAILDVGTINLNQSFKRVPVPSDMVDRIVPVLNQDPELPLVFDSITPVTQGDTSRIEMVGGVLDTGNKLGLPRDAHGRVIGLEVVHSISLGLRGRQFALSTTLVNHTGGSVPVYSIGDFIEQRGSGGFRAVVPAQYTSGLTQAAGTSTVGPATLSLVHDWGVEIPGSDFTKPLETSVRATGVGLQGAESAGDFVDSHMSMGIMGDAASQTHVLVAVDPQHVLSEPRPKVPARIVVGKVPEFDPMTNVPKQLGAAASLTYDRILYAISGASQGAQRTSQASSIFNQMLVDRVNPLDQVFGAVSFSTFGTAIRSGSLQTEFRFERYLAPAVFNPEGDKLDDSKWITERVEFLERGEVFDSNAVTLSSSPNLTLLPAIPELSADPSRTGHNQIYRVIVRNRNEGANTPFLKFTNASLDRQTNLADYLEPRDGKTFSVREHLAPERNNFPFAYDDAGNQVNYRLLSQFFASRDTSGVAGVLQPMRIAIAGLDSAGNLDPTKDPNLLRSRHWSTMFTVFGTHKTAGDQGVGAVSFRAGNEAFGTGFPGAAGGVFLAGHFELPPMENFRAFAIRGPLSTLHVEDFQVAVAGGSEFSSILFKRKTAPSGWLSFDMPGPSMATTGGMHPMEQLAGAVAEDVQVVGRTETDRSISATESYAGFRYEITGYIQDRSFYQPIGDDPLVVGARSSTLADCGTVTALFTPDPAVAGAPSNRVNSAWTLADFLSQAEGQFNVVHRPLGPGGLFTVKGFSLTDPLVDANPANPNHWWTLTSPYSDGKKMGDFDALELLRGESLASQTPASWHQEYKDLRKIWFKLVSAQSPSFFTKALGLSSGQFSVDTPVGLARTYLKVPATPTESDLSGVLSALKSGAAVASTGPMLEVDVNGTAGPGQLLTGTNASVTLNIALTAPDWVPVEQVRIYVNGSLVQTLDPSTFAVDPADGRRRTVSVPGLALTQDSCIVVEAGTPDAGPTLGSAPWNTLYPVWFKLERGIYPLAITNPIFVLRNGGTYTPPGN
ncbi:MAG TPA: hypothetical protein VJ623_06535 [Holophagaceae bacterium]|nr:hypothetical protein [Holophagaceae bacterium]